MPYLLVRTNKTVSPDKLEHLLAKFSTATAEALGKPERYVMVSLEAAQSMYFAGDGTPCAYLELESIGLPEAQTQTLSATLCKLVTDELAIQPDRIYIEFSGADRHMCGWNGATF